MPTSHAGFKNLSRVRRRPESLSLTNVFITKRKPNAQPQPSNNFQARHCRLAQSRINKGDACRFVPVRVAARSRPRILLLLLFHVISTGPSSHSEWGGPPSRQRNSEQGPSARLLALCRACLRTAILLGSVVLKLTVLSAGVESFSAFPNPTVSHSKKTRMGSLPRLWRFRYNRRLQPTS